MKDQRAERIGDTEPEAEDAAVALARYKHAFFASSDFLALVDSNYVLGTRLNSTTHC